MTTEALGVDIYIPVTFATGGVPVNNFGTAPTLLSAARNGTAFTPSSATVSANGTSPQSYGYTLQGAETTLQGAGKYTLVFQCLDATADYSTWIVELEVGQAWVTAISTLVNRLGAFTGTGVNTVLGFFKALMSKAASTPSDVGGTFDASTDSAEAIRDRGDAAWTGSTPASAAEIADAVLDEAVSGHTVISGSLAYFINAIKSKTDRIVASGVRSIRAFDPTTQTLTLVRGNTKTITFEDLDDTWTGATNIKLGIRRAGQEDLDPIVEIAGAAVSASSVSVTLPTGFGVTAPELEVGGNIYEWDLTGKLSTGEVVTVISISPLIIKDRIARVS